VTVVHAPFIVTTRPWCGEAPGATLVDGPGPTMISNNLWSDAVQAFAREAQLKAYVADTLALSPQAPTRASTSATGTPSRMPTQPLTPPSRPARVRVRWGSLAFGSSLVYFRASSICLNGPLPPCVLRGSSSGALSWEEISYH
jgi:hypothetical protein